jgi:hypothetical protein
LGGAAGQGPLPLNRAGQSSTFRPMRVASLLRLLLLALSVSLGLAEGAEHTLAPIPAGATYGVAGSAISAPRQSLPTPVHDEATCAFCQAAIFPPLAPAPAVVSVTTSALVREVRVAAGDRLPRLVSHRAASSRAPPQLRIG